MRELLEGARGDGREMMYADYRWMYFMDCIVELHQHVPMNNYIAYSKAVRLMPRQLDSSIIGYDEADLYAVLRTCAKPYFQFKICKNDKGILMRHLKRTEFPIDMDELEHLLKTRIPHVRLHVVPNFSNGAHKGKVILNERAYDGSLKYYFKLQVNEDMEFRIFEILRDDLQWVKLYKVQELHAGLLCIVEYNGNLWRALVVTIREPKPNHVHCELIDVGLVVDAHADLVFELDPRDELYKMPRCALPACLDLNVDPRHVNAYFDEEDKFGRKFRRDTYISRIKTDYIEYVALRKMN